MYSDMNMEEELGGNDDGDEGQESDDDVRQQAQDVQSKPSDHASRQLSMERSRSSSEITSKSATPTPETDDSKLEPVSEGANAEPEAKDLAEKPEVTSSSHEISSEVGLKVKVPLKVEGEAPSSSTFHSSAKLEPSTSATQQKEKESTPDVPSIDSTGSWSSISASEEKAAPLRKRAHSDARRTSFTSRDGDEGIRRSKREIKRPKFDDELVQSGSTFKKRSFGGTSAASHGARSSTASTPAHQSEAFDSHRPSSAGSSSATEKEEGMSPIPAQMTAQHRERSHTHPKMADKYRPPKKEQEKEKKHDRDAHKNRSSAELESPVPSPVVYTKPEKHFTRKRVSITAAEKRATCSSDEDDENPVRGERGSKDIRSKELAAAAEAVESLATDELRSWTAADDVALISAASHIADLSAVLQNVRFSQPFTLQDIEERWYRMLYDEKISRQARKRISEMAPEDILRIQSRTAFSKQEEVLLAAVLPNPLPTHSVMEGLLNERREEFHSARTPQVLHDHWHRMKQSNLLVQYSSAEHQPAIDWERIERSTDLNNDLCFDYRRPLRSAVARTRIAAPLQRVSVVPVTGITNEKLGDTVFAAMKGRVVRFVVRTERVTIGRSTPRGRVDVDLSLEGPAMKVSRKQALLEYKREQNEFTLENTGGRPMFVDGRPLPTNTKVRLVDGSIIEVAGIRLVFKTASTVQTPTPQAVVVRPACHPLLSIPGSPTVGIPGVSRN